MNAHILDAEAGTYVEGAIRKVLDESAASQGIALTDGRMAEIMARVESGDLIPYIFADDEDKIIGMALVKVVADDITGERNLLIYAAATFDNTPLALWDACFSTVSELARRWDCKNIAAYTAVERIKRLARRWGGHELSYFKIPIEG